MQNNRNLKRGLDFFMKNLQNLIFETTDYGRRCRIGARFAAAAACRGADATLI